MRQAREWETRNSISYSKVDNDDTDNAAYRHARPSTHIYPVEDQPICLPSSRSLTHLLIASLEWVDDWEEDASTADSRGGGSL